MNSTKVDRQGEIVEGAKASKRIKMDPTEVDRRAEIEEDANGSAETDIIKRVTKSEDPLLQDELLPGILNEVTLTCIFPRLSRRAYQVVANLNPDWQRAFESRIIYEARVLLQTTETFLLVACTVRFKNIFSLFSPSEKRWYKCPLIPGYREGGYQNNFIYLPLDTAIYRLGGTRSPTKCRIPSSEVLVLDLARYPLEWRRCANMQVPRVDPTTHIFRGKIYVFGGTTCSDGCCPEVRNEVYDPKVDAWSFIAPTMPSASVSRVFSVGQQLLACIGVMDRPTPPKEHVRDKEAYISDSAKLVVRVDDRGAKLITTSDDDAEDDMDGLHEIIEKKLDDLGKGFRFPPADDLAFTIAGHERLDSDSGTPTSFFGFYDPTKDEWSAFDKKSLGKDNVDQDQRCEPKFLGSFPLLRWRERSLLARLACRATVYSISL